MLDWMKGKLRVNIAGRNINNIRYDITLRQRGKRK